MIFLSSYRASETDEEKKKRFKGKIKKQKDLQPCKQLYGFISVTTRVVFHKIGIIYQDFTSVYFRNDLVGNDVLSL